MAFHQNLSQELPLHHFSAEQTQPPQTQQQQQQQQNIPESTTAPNWLNTALLRTQQPQPPSSHSHFTSNNNFLNLHTTTSTTNSDSTASQNPTQWLSRSSSLLNRNHSDVIDDVTVATAADSIIARNISHESADLKTNTNNNGETMNNKSEGGMVESDGGGSGGGEGVVNWQNARYKAEILSHPLYDQLLSAHVACLRIATPVDQLPRIDAQLAQSQHVVAKYSALGGGTQGMVVDDKELDQFMTHYFLLLCSFKEQLQQHVRIHAMEAVMACWEIEQSLQSLTGVSPGEGTGATMSDDDEDQVDSDANLFDTSLDGSDTMGFGPLIPTESERSLMERVRHELKHDLKQGYKEKIADIREEILRKRRAGKLPGDTTSVLKSWWQSHSKWPYPTEEDKARLVQETGLQLKQINNWFINQRKRNWHSNPSTSTVLKSKRKSNAGDNGNDRFM
ncbi:homeobox protein knotted-1-like 3 isoform X2 [Hevea brasiliensis]|uniref:homeobox protein knotted-1-like 3 isoform X2 n=1 Tax=Hevea brasiliensis TaxID=3981 RepID=UPI0025D318B6|nr:homeobox protein knotted-1-like 3 isoform X2 [Hevea brasiliensis]